MSIKYTLNKNNLTGVGYSGKIISTDTITLTQLIEMIIVQGNTVAKSDILAVFAELETLVGQFLKLGFRVNLDGFCSMYPRIKGNFTSSSDAFEAARHELLVGASIGKNLSAVVKENDVIIEKVDTITNRPLIKDYYDIASATENVIYTGGNIGQLNGKRLSFDQTQPDEGVFFIDSLDENESIQATSYQHNAGTRLVFLIPITPLTSGEGYVEVRTRMGVTGGPLRKFNLEEVKLTSA